MTNPLRALAPACLLAATSAILTVAFCLPLGRERLLATTPYQHLEGFAGSFDTPKLPASPSNDEASARSETIGLVTQAVRQKYTPVQANALMNRVESLTQAKPSLTKGASRRDRSKAHRPSAAAVEVATSSVPAKLEAPATPSVALKDSIETVGDRYEDDAAKFPMDKTIAQGTIAMRLRGLSRSGDRCTLKVEVTNRGEADFFVKELSVQAGQDLRSKSYIRLFVEPGRTREGFVVFDKPHAGADVHIALKEDREKGRVVELPVPYPF